MNIAVFVSGNGTNLQAIIDAVKSGYIKARIAVVLSDRKDAHAMERAKKAGVETVFVDPKAHKSREDFDSAIIDCLERREIELICLAGYMRLLTPAFIRRYRNRILNVHPALLPSFKGLNGVKDALDYGVKITGPTVHFVTEDVDSGPIIAQSVVQVEDGDTEDSLREKVHKEEHKIYPKAVKDFVEGKLKLKGRRVVRK
ncbi:MAG: phosphoribosylglycinamide formyltransferase [Candidatus Omnitrophica bacterium]|nr:phosphoribosylglycinamide formyltransferase [Candidatus Omnitrophota bacterium]